MDYEFGLEDFVEGQAEESSVNNNWRNEEWMGFSQLSKLQNANSMDDMMFDAEIVSEGQRNHPSASILLAADPRLQSPKIMDSLLISKDEKVNQMHHLIGNVQRLPINSAIPYGRSLPVTFSPASQYKSAASLSASVPRAIPHPQVTIGSISSPNTASSLNESMFSFKATSAASLEELAAKQKRRKDNHNAVERRRRDHINEMIQKLSFLLNREEGRVCGLPGDNSSRLNKGEVLERAVNRIVQSNKLINTLMERLVSLNDAWRPTEYDEILKTLYVDFAAFSEAQ